MRESHDGGGTPAPQGTRGLSTCSKCQGIFPAARLTAIDGERMCGDCNRKWGPLDASGRVSVTDDAAVRPSYDARIVTSSTTGDEPVAGAGARDPQDPRHLGGALRPRANPMLVKFGDGQRAEDGPGSGAWPPLVGTDAAVPPPLPASEGGGARASQVPPPIPAPDAARASRSASHAATGHSEPSGPGARASQDDAAARAAVRGSSAMPPWAQHAPGAARPAAPNYGYGGAPADPAATPAPTASRTAPADDPLDQPARPVLSKSKFPQWQGSTPLRNAGVAPAPPPVAAVPSAAAAMRASQADVRRVSQFDADMRRVTQEGAGGRDNFEAYAEIRKKVDAGDDTLETRRRAAEMATRLGLHFEAVEHYKRCCELAPGDEGLRLRLDNVQRSVGFDRGGAAPAPEPARRVQEEARPFWEDLGGALSYPFRGGGVAVLLVGGVLFGIGQLIGTINMFAWTVSAMLWGYVAAYLFEVINSTAAGKTDPPGLPEATNVLESYIFPFFAYVACGFVSFVPLLASVWLWQKGWLPAPVSIVLILATFALGFFVFPMTLMVRAMFQSVSDAANPAVILGAIGRILPDYVGMFIATCLLWIAFGFAYSIAWFLTYVTLGAPSPDAVFHFDFGRIAAWILFTILTWPVFLYAWMLQGHLLGRLYRQSLRRLGWFTPPTEQLRSARKMSTGLGVAAGCALLALCGAAYGAWSVFERYAASPNAGSFGLKCPFGDGSKLTYFWEHTDGAAGLTEYTFYGQADGTMRVTASTRIAGHPGEGGVETVGIFDPDTGVFTEAVPVWGQGVHYDGRTGQHVPFFGPKRASLGSTYINDWSIRASERWQGTWPAWKVHQETSTLDLYFDSKTGVLVGSSFSGIGFKVTAWLTEAHNVPGLVNGPPADRDFSDSAPPVDDFIGLPIDRGMPLPPHFDRR